MLNTMRRRGTFQQTFAFLLLLLCFAGLVLSKTSKLPLPYQAHSINDLEMTTQELIKGNWVVDSLHSFVCWTDLLKRNCELQVRHIISDVEQLQRQLQLGRRRVRMFLLRLRHEGTNPPTRVPCWMIIFTLLTISSLTFLDLLLCPPWWLQCTAGVLTTFQHNWRHDRSYLLTCAFIHPF